jgi:uncharacterized protein YsxB (DUF464 family)
MVNVYAEKDGNRYLLCVKDHATGSDIVCAAVSALVYAFAGYAANFAAETYGMRLESGNATIHCTGGDDVEASFNTVVTGLKQIELSHPEYIKVEEREQA